MSAIGAVSEAAQQNIGGFRPSGRGEIEQFYREMPEFLRDLGSAFNHAADNMGDMHVHAAVIEMTRQVAQVIASCAGTADDTYQSHSREHSLWLND